MAYKIIVKELSEIDLSWRYRFADKDVSDAGGHAPIGMSSASSSRRLAVVFGVRLELEVNWIGQSDVLSKGQLGNLVT